MEFATGLVILAILIVGPLPLCVSALPASRIGPWSLSVLIVLVIWCALQMSVAVAVGMVGRYGHTFFLVAEIVVFSVGLVAVRAYRAGIGAILPIPSIGSRLDRVLVIGLSIQLAALLWWCAAMPIVNYDSWSFHLPTMARWLQSGDFVRFDQFTTQPRVAYPYGWEAAMGMFTMPFGDDFFITFPVLVTWVILGLSVYRLAADLGASRIHALACSSILLSYHLVVGLVNTAHTDLQLAAFFAATLTLLCSCGGEGFRRRLPIILVSAGVLCSSRTTGPIYLLAALGLAYVLRPAARRWPPRPPVGQHAPEALLLTVGAAVGIFVGAFWWLKNIADYGSPLGPVSLGVSNVAAPPGYSKLASFASTAVLFGFEPTDPAMWRDLLALVRLELGFPFIATLSLVGLAPIAWWRSRRDGSRFPAARLFVLCAVLFLLAAMTPSGITQIRVWLPFWAGLSVAAAVVATRARVPGEACVALALLCVAMANAHSRVLYAALPVVVGWGAFRAGRPVWRPRFAVNLFVLVGIGAAVTFAARYRRDAARIEFYGPTYEYLDNEIGDQEVVGFLFGARSYHLYGTKLKRRVHHVPLDSRSVEAWVADVRRRGITLVAIGPGFGREAEKEAVRRLEAPRGPLLHLFGTRQAGTITLYRIAES